MSWLIVALYALVGRATATMFNDVATSDDDCGMGAAWVFLGWLLLSLLAMISLPFDVSRIRARRSRWITAGSVARLCVFLGGMLPTAIAWLRS